jgi:protein-L-isoaspartate O-methyltransferase
VSGPRFPQGEGLVDQQRHPAVRVGDGALGAVGTRRFDALIATCGMPDIPAAWLTQTRPGAVVVPVGTGVVRLVR